MQNLLDSTGKKGLRKELGVLMHFRCCLLYNVLLHLDAAFGIG